MAKSRRPRRPVPCKICEEGVLAPKQVRKRSRPVVHGGWGLRIFSCALLFLAAVGLFASPSDGIPAESAAVATEAAEGDRNARELDMALVRGTALGLGLAGLMMLGMAEIMLARKKVLACDTCEAVVPAS